MTNPTPTPGSQAQRREWITQSLLADASRSDRAVGRACTVSHHTVAAVRRGMEAAGQIQARPAHPPVGDNGSPGNLLPASFDPRSALKHGVDSNTTLAPLRTRFEDGLRTEFPWLDDRRLFLLADLLSRVEAARRWLDIKGGVVRDRSGNCYPVVDRLESWSNRADKLLRDLHAEAEKRQSAAGQGLDGYIRANYPRQPAEPEQAEVVPEPDEEPTDG